ncbi:Uncharacterised protein [Legionella pneumophila]|nr:Uncharacterised protein [Legionella pneumophila]CZG20473.1 Uncharacterised protein [Legionella pneumophila]CZG28484.1 Uncharacterised protein [Legionella pneumophila]
MVDKVIRVLIQILFYRGLKIKYHYLLRFMGKVKQHLMKEAVLVLMQEFFIKLKRILQLILRLINVSLAF